MTDALNTVAITVPGTQTRVLVERLLGRPEDAPAVAIQAVRELMQAPVLRTQVLRSDEITDVHFPTETT